MTTNIVAARANIATTLVWTTSSCNEKLSVPRWRRVERRDDSIAPRLTPHIYHHGNEDEKRRVAEVGLLKSFEYET